MCDYSLDFLEAKPAKVGDRLIHSRFKNTPTRGFADYNSVQNCVVCLLPGTVLEFDTGTIEARRFLNWLPNKKYYSKRATFVKTNLEQINVHHDALQLENGKIVLINDIEPGYMATVVSIPGSEDKITKAVFKIMENALKVDHNDDVVASDKLALQIPAK